MRYGKMTKLASVLTDEDLVLLRWLLQRYVNEKEACIAFMKSAPEELVSEASVQAMQQDVVKLKRTLMRLY